MQLPMELRFAILICLQKRRMDHSEHMTTFNLCDETFYRFEEAGIE